MIVEVIILDVVGAEIDPQMAGMLTTALLARSWCLGDRDDYQIRIKPLDETAKPIAKLKVDIQRNCLKQGTSAQTLESHSSRLTWSIAKNRSCTQRPVDADILGKTRTKVARGPTGDIEMSQPQAKRLGYAVDTDLAILKRAG